MKKCISPRRVYKNLDPIKYPQGLEISCGQCMACRLQRREEWVTRLAQESIYWENMMFLTLTYDKNHLPENGSIKKVDLQLFLKRLRKNIEPLKIKYFACGDYGENTARPHYHLLIFGLSSLSSEDRQSVKDTWTLCQWNMLSDKETFGTVEVPSIRYVVGYIEKVVNGKEEKYAYENIEKPFNLCSKGLGKKFAQEHKSLMQEKGYTLIQGNKKSIPRYYKKILELENTESSYLAENKERETIEQITGIFATRDELYHLGTAKQVINVEESLKRSNTQYDKNIKAKRQNKIRSSKKTL
ncbi:MAG: replication initiator protein [Arizlama microvirus]|nr:MAG: replication initiator protein [Arizlama microvirus]